MSDAFFERVFGDSQPGDFGTGWVSGIPANKKFAEGFLMDPVKNTRELAQTLLAWRSDRSARRRGNHSKEVDGIGDSLCEDAALDAGICPRIATDKPRLTRILWRYFGDEESLDP